MKYGIFGDIHGNMAALEAVLKALREAGCQKLICTGDVTGYGPCPHECIARVRESGAVCVLGNHDEYVANLLDSHLAKLDADTRNVIEWMRATLPMEDIRWLASLPVSVESDGFTVLHGMLGPQHWGYVTNVPTLTAHFTHQATPIAFNGHTHLPLYGCQMPGKSPTIDFLRTTIVPPHAKVLINPGGVGQPRDRDPRAACCVYDTETRQVHPVRAEYDIAATQAMMRQSGLPERFAERLALGK
jgi:predicted phosphodiesterase